MVTRQYRTVLGGRIDHVTQRIGVNVVARDGRYAATCQRCGQDWQVRYDRAHLTHLLCRDCRSVHDPLWSTP